MSEPQKTSRSPWWPPLAAALAHAALMLVAGPPLNLWPLALIAPTPLFWYLRRGTDRPKRDALLLMLGVSPMWLVWEWWMIDVTAPGFPFFILLQCSWTALFFLVVRRLHAHIPRVPWLLLAPLVWVAVEFFRGEIFLSGYAAALMPYPLIHSTTLATPASWLGVYFVSFLTLLFASAIFDVILGRGRERVRAAVALALLIVTWAAAGVQVHRTPLSDQAVTPGIVQTNLPQSNKLAWTEEAEIRDWERFSNLTVSMATSEPRPDFILWPETMMPGWTLEMVTLPNGEKRPMDAFYDALMDIQHHMGIPMIVGEDALVNLTIDRTDPEKPRLKRDARHNSAYLVVNGQVQPERYDKVRLTPFGETMPFISRWPWLEKQMLSFGVGAQGMKFDLAPGTSHTVIPVPLASGSTVRVVAPICFESTVNGFCRELVFENGQRRADLIANLTNDGWFGNSDIARAQHLDISRWRCVELATPMARAANTGISALIDAQGRILSRGVEGSQQESRIDGILRGSVPLGTGTTLFARLGNVFPWSVLGLTTAALLVTFVRKWGRQATPADSRAKRVRLGARGRS
ncbi:MAG TPA: apolipoprotein N-acyltransferase [Phycisphaerales bacterium]|nr:apolipoprotein N-acyltransferase [Phycisphaerales bacterium]